MQYTTDYQQKLITADAAAALIQTGDTINFGWAACTPIAIDKALAKRAGELEDVVLRGGVLVRPLEILEREDAHLHFTWNSLHMSAFERRYTARGSAFYIPIRYSEVPRYVRENMPKADVTILQTAPMDEHGYFNFGPSNSHSAALCENANTVIIEVNENIPYCYGAFEECIHISKVDYIVEDHSPLLPETEPVEPAASEVDKTIARIIVDEIPDGACLQLGIGGMPNAVGKLIAETDLKDLGVHTEMYTEAFVDLAYAGIVNGSRKNIAKGKQVFTFANASRKVFDYIDKNPAVMSAPVNYTNDIRVISSIDNFISINNAIDVDLFGQVSSESSGFRHISGAGGQLDFVVGAYMSNGGKSFICCSSTFTDKAGNLKSRILPSLKEGSVVTDTRSNIHYLVTEYGKVCLKGMSTWERAEAVISVAHPAFRDQLIENAEQMNIWRNSNRR